MTIDDRKVLNNDGMHGMDEKSFDVALSVGLHKIKVEFFQKGGGEGLKVEWKQSGKEKSEISKTVLLN